MKYSAPNRFIIFITNDWYFTILNIICMDGCTDLSLKMLGKSIKSISLLIKGIEPLDLHLNKLGKRPMPYTKYQAPEPSSSGEEDF